ncbi:MAG: gliding motility-associated-like protein [Arenicella sp.]|jgi:gliding motility-associated-like protein
MKYLRISLTNVLALLLTTCILTLASESKAQCPSTCGPNLIGNSSFETMSSDCGTINSEIFTDYSQVQDWMGTACLTCPGNGSTPDYYNSSCTGAAPTDNCGMGTASVGFFTSVEVGGTGGSNSREYVQTQLTSTLVAGQEYCATITVKTSPGSFAYVPTDGLGLWFTNGMVDIDVDNAGQQYLGPGSLVNATPQIANPSGNIIDTICTTITGSFIATGTESWMVMGNFRPDNVMQTTATCGGLFSFCFGYLIVDQVDLVAVCTSCDATITASGPYCISDTPINLTSLNSGGTWSGPGITDAVNGTFDPSTAGIGVHNIIYDLTCGDDDTIAITVNAMDDSTFTYSNSTYCSSDTDPLPIVTGLSGGTFSIDNAGVIDASSGSLDLSASGAGSYTISYLTNSSCPTTGSFSLDILDSEDASINAAGPFCENDPSINLSALNPGGTWSGVGITSTTVGTFDPVSAGAGLHTIYHEFTGLCGDIDSVEITVNALDDPGFSYAQSTFCISSGNPIPTVSGLNGGTFSIDAGGVINSSTGEIDLLSSGLGNYIVSYLTNGLCPSSSSTFNLTISSSLDATITAAGPFCESEASVNLSSIDGGGTWTGNGITDASIGIFDPGTATSGNHQIIYTILGACGDADTITIIVNPSDDASISYASTTFCTSEVNPNATIVGTNGGVFTIDNSGVINSSTGEIDLDASGSGSYLITYITSGLCPDTATFNITITDGSAVNITDAGPYCLGTGDVTLMASVSGGVWSGTGITDVVNGTFNTDIAGIGSHQIVYSIAGLCGTSDTIYIDIADQATIDFPSSYTTTYGGSITLNPTYTGSGSFIWSPSEELDCDDCSSPSISPTQTTTICVVYSNGVCSDSACTQIIVDYDCGEVAVPTAFTPNSGDANALECVLGTCVVNMQFKIYDRWGELVFESIDPNSCWDGTHIRNGKEMSTGVYVYQLEADLIDGTSVSQNGNITLLR